MEPKIGLQLRNLRKSLGMSIASLAAKSGVSTGLISQLERDMVVPSVANLYRIAQAMGTNINYFFEEPEEKNIRLIRRGDHRTISTHGTNSFELLIPDNLEHTIDVVRITLKGGQSQDYDCISHEGEECGYVISGVLTLLCNGKEYTLYPGDSIFFDSTMPHNYYNRTDEDCVSIWSMTPKFF